MVSCEVDRVHFGSTAGDLEIVEVESSVVDGHTRLHFFVIGLHPHDQRLGVGHDRAWHPVAQLAAAVALHRKTDTEVL